MVSGQLSHETEANHSVVPHIHHLISQDRTWRLQEGCASLAVASSCTNRDMVLAWTPSAVMQR